MQSIKTFCANWLGKTHRCAGPKDAIQTVHYSAGRLRQSPLARRMPSKAAPSRTGRVRKSRRGNVSCQGPRGKVGEQVPTFTYRREKYSSEAARAPITC